MKNNRFPALCQVRIHTEPQGNMKTRHMSSGKHTVYSDFFEDPISFFTGFPDTEQGIS